MSFRLLREQGSGPFRVCARDRPAGEQSNVPGVQIRIVSFRRCLRSQSAFRHPIILTVIVSVLSALPGTADGRHPARKADPIISRMANVDVFAFGGIGFVLAISDGERDYRVILSRPSAAADFETVFELGNSQAKCYALVGLRQTSPKRFESLAARFESSRTLVRVTRGCVEFGCPMPDMIKCIRSGVYSGSFTHGLVPPPGPAGDEDAVSR